MLKWLSLSALVVSGVCHSEQSIWQNKSNSWSSNYNARTEVTLSRLEYDFAGIQDEQRELTLAMKITRDWVFDTRISVRKHDLESGLCRLNMRSSAIEMMPAMYFDNGIKLGLGYRHFVSGRVNVGSEYDFDLDQGSSLFISTRLTDIFGQDQFEIRLSNTRLDSSDNALVNPNQHFSQNALRFLYKARF